MKDTELEQPAMCDVREIWAKIKVPKCGNIFDCAANDDYSSKNVEPMTEVDYAVQASDGIMQEVYHTRPKLVGD